MTTSQILTRLYLSVFTLYSSSSSSSVIVYSNSTSDFSSSSSYNLCPDNVDQPVLLYKQYTSPQISRVIQSDHIRVIVQESFYNPLQGTFHFVITPFSGNVEERGETDDYWNYYAKLKPQMSELATHLSCWDSFTSMVTPVTKNFVNGHAHGEILCPYIPYPNPIPFESIVFVLLTDYSGPHLQIVHYHQVVEQSNFVSTNISVCAHHRPVVENSWCSNGIKGPDMQVRLREFILYHHAIGIDRFLFFDDDGTYKPTFQPFIDAGIVEYVHSKPYFPNQPQGYMQDTNTAICRSRYFSSTKWIGFYDIDEFIVFNQPNDIAFTDIRLQDKDYNGQSVIQPILDREPSMIPSMISEAVSALQNLQANRQFQIVGITLAECMSLEDKNPSSNSLVERFTDCNRNHHEHKYFYKANSDVTGTGHEARSPTQFTTDYLNRNQIMIVHFYNSVQLRHKFESQQHYRIPISIIKKTISRMEKLMPLNHPIRLYS